MIPTAECELSKDGTQLVVARCPLCGKTHRHGAGKPGTPEYPVLGHRVAHCFDPKSPYDRSGYHLVVGGKLPRYKAGMPRRRPNIDLILKYGWY